VETLNPRALESNPETNRDHKRFVTHLVRRFRQECPTNEYTRWLPRRKLLNKRARAAGLVLPSSWIVHLPERAPIIIKPDAIIGFEVFGSADRILILMVDTGEMHVESDSGDSLLLRTSAIRGADMGMLRQSRRLIAWIMHSPERSRQLKDACVRHGLDWVCLTDRDAIIASPTVIFIRWQVSGQADQTIV
jgi:hypothetical protein